MNRRELRVCVDRVVPHHASASRAAMRDTLRTLGAQGRGPGTGGNVSRMAILALRKWTRTTLGGDTLRCRFLEGSARQRSRVRDVASEWEQYAGIKLDWESDAEAHVRIAFREGDGSWSAVGNDALVASYFPQHQPTMNFGWLQDDTDDVEFHRVVLHEFGHALGCIHEHQSPSSPLKWKKEVVYDYFSGPPNYWSRRDIDHNIFETYSLEETNSTSFDGRSIMLYQFPGDFFEDGQATSSNAALSDEDKKFIGLIYPKSV